MTEQIQTYIFVGKKKNINTEGKMYLKVYGIQGGTKPG